VHVTLRSVCRSLRTQFVFPTVRGAIHAANRAASEWFRVVHFSIQADHVHLIVEARDRASLVEGVRGLCIRLARRVNQLIGRRGRFFADRWHGRALESPRAVRNALVYVLANFRKHGHGHGVLVDAYSSALYFVDFVEFDGCAPIERHPTLLPRALAPPLNSTALAKSWLLSTGWKRHGKISIREQPA
jgi:REP element-mobilizing transposase RayT